MSETDPREAKLPKWAQASLADLRESIEALTLERDNLARGSLGDADSNTVALLGKDNNVHLPKGCAVEYTVGYSIHDRVTVFVDDFGDLHLVGAGVLGIAPISANEVRVDVAGSL